MNSTVWDHLATSARDVEELTHRLDAVVPGEWDLTLEELPPLDGIVAFKARLQILGVIRESTSSNAIPTYLHAADSAFMNAARLFGIEHAK